jgi:hypothetical protein
MMPRTSGRAACLCLLCILFITGCGRSLGEHNAIRGAVTCDGRPLVLGSITFVPIDGMRGNVSGGEIKDGRYLLTSKNGPASGWQRVEIRASKKTGRKVPDPAYVQHDVTMDEQVEAIPVEFNSDSKLKFEVKPGENTADFDVRSK